MILVIGEILFDIFGDVRRLGGAPFNFAYHLKHFGIPVRFISRVGDDVLGQEILEKLDAAQFDVADVQIDPDHPTGTVVVRIDDLNSPEFDILPDVAYDFIEFDPVVHPALVSAAELIYFGSLVQRSTHGMQNVQTVLNQKHPDTRCFYDINLRPKGYNQTVIVQSLNIADILKINDTEFNIVKDMLNNQETPDEFKRSFMDRYALEAIALTRGAAGSEWITRAGIYSAATVEVPKMVDSVGAGDAYAAMLVAGLRYQWAPETLLQRAAQFAARICGIRGAIPDAPDFYEPFLAMIQKGGENAG